MQHLAEPPAWDINLVPDTDEMRERFKAELQRAIAALDVLVACTGGWADAARPNLKPLIARFARNDKMREPRAFYTPN